MDVPIAPPAPDADGGARAPGTARPDRQQLGRQPLWRRRPAGDAAREPAPAWMIVFGLGLLVVAGIVGWRAWHAPRPPEPFPLRVVDEAGRPVEGAIVALTLPPSGLGFAQVSDAEGRVRFGDEPLWPTYAMTPDDGTGLVSVIPRSEDGGFRAARVGTRWFRVVSEQAVRRGDVVRLATVPVVALEAHLDAEDGPVVLVDFRRDAGNLNAPTIPGDPDGRVRVPVMDGGTHGELVSPDVEGICTSGPIVVRDEPAGVRRVVVRAARPLVRVALETSDGAPRTLTRGDIGRRRLGDGADRRVRVFTWYRFADGRFGDASGILPVVVGGDLAFAALDARFGVAVRVEGEGWARHEAVTAPPPRVRLRRSVLRVPLAALAGVPPEDVARLRVRGPMHWATVPGRRDGADLVFDDVPAGGWDLVVERPHPDGDWSTFSEVGTLTVDVDGRLASGPTLERR